jgi:formamidopyrimidine-DNA glycosylase
MPELPEVETVRRGLVPVLEGRRIVDAVARRPDLRRRLPDRFAERLTGARVEAVERRAKYLLFRLSTGEVLIGHLGMAGRLFLEHDRPPLGPHDHVVIEIEGGLRLRFNDARRFGLLLLCAAERLARHPLIAGLGPEPLDPAFDGPALAAALAGKRTPIKAALLDQRVVAGLGNIYVSEALFGAGLSPRRLARTVQGARADRLAAAIKDVLARAIAAGGSSLRDYVQPSGELGYFQHRWAVYDREGGACAGCACDPAATGGVRRIVQSGRSTFYCPRRQR